MKNKEKLIRWYIAIYSLLCLYLPMLIIPRSVYTLKYIIGKTAAELLYDVSRISEHMVFPFIVFCVIFTVFMLFFAYRIKPIGLEKAVLLALVNIALPIALINLQGNGLFKTMYVFDIETFYALITLAVVVVIVSLTISAALKVCADEKATENVTEA